MSARLIAALIVVATVLAACGSDGTADPADSLPGTETTTPETTPPETSAPPTTVAETVVDTVPAATEPPSTSTPAADDPETAAAAAWSTVFDSTVPFEEKVPFLADAEALRPTVDAYTAAGAGFGGISLEPTAVAITESEATITYDVNFGANPAYGDQVGTVTLVDGVWTVSRDEFCSFMASARVTCS